MYQPYKKDEDIIVLPYFSSLKQEQVEEVNSEDAGPLQQRSP
jgi:hypothetical protein